ncbi:AAA family ATPase [Micromonospora sp. NPDC049497]|uniref:AAA family ATPase n=1 Tax=Micromonospora sp. NPDC049497 TaxID=3364273 RepID=UPI00379A3F8D
MRPLELTFSGLRSYRSRQHIDFRGQSLVGITGDTGAGKSSIFIAINFALFGACTFEAATPKVLIADGGDGVLAVELIFEARGKEWKVSRRLSKTSTNSHHRLEALDGSETRVGRDAANTRIQQLIGLDQKTFVRSVLLRQGKFEELLHASPAERTRMLKGLLGLDILDTIAQQARDRRDAIIPQLHTLNERKAALFEDPRATAAQADIVIGQADEQIEQLKTAKDQLASLDKQRTDAVHERGQLLELADALACALKTDAPEQLAGLAADDAALSTEDGALIAELAPLRQQRHELLDELGDRRPGGPLADVPATAATTLGQLREVLEQEAEASNRHAAAATELYNVQNETTGIEAKASDLTTQRLTLEQEHKDAESAEADLQKQLDAWRTDLRTARELTASVMRLGQELKAQQADHAAAAATLKQHRATAEQADQATTAAEETLEAQKRLNAAAYAATDLGPGDACLICQHQLPDGFVPPHAPALHTAEQALRAARAQARRTANLVTAALSKERETHTLAQQTATRLAATSAQAHSALSVLTRQLGCFVNLDQSDDQILQAPLEALAGAQELTAAKAADLGQVRNSAAEAIATAKAINKDIVSRTKQIEKATEHLGVLRTRITGLIRQLPAEYRPEPPSPDEVDQLKKQAVADRLRLGEQWNTLTQLGTATQHLEERRAQLATKRADHITAPAQQSQQRMLAITAAYTTLAAVLHSPPASTLDLTADIATQARWAIRTKDLAQQAVEAGRARAAAITPLFERIAGQAADITRNAPTDGKPIETACDDAVGRRAVAVETRDTALTQIPIMADLQRRITAVQPHLDALNVLVELLGNGKFGTAVVQERQQNLLGSATTIIRGMTLGRFAFGPDFQIYDSHTGSLRDVKTLSGGETFQASLALALAVVEQASSSGGRAESLFLDEGFGSLDHNALTYALDALSTQVTVGRLVVVISHMLAVAQHVPALLRVTKNGAGSTVRWATDTELHELADDLETGSLHV